MVVLAAMLVVFSTIPAGFGFLMVIGGQGLGGVGSIAFACYLLLLARVFQSVVPR